MTGQSTPVLIVGGGPVGLALSIDLSWRGIHHVLVERDDPSARAVHPRMDQVGIRSMEHFRRLGIVAEIEAAGFPRDMQRDVVFATAVLGHELAREPFEADATRAPPPFSPQKHELCPQNFLDPALQAVAQRSPLADIRYRTRLTGLAEHGGVVHCRLAEEATGREHTLVADYVAGCDGSGGFVASHLGLSPQASTTLARSTNIFVTCPELRWRRAGPGAYRYVLVGPKGVWASVVNMDGRNLWRIQVLGDAERPSWSPEDLHDVVQRAVGAEVDYHLESIVPWVRRELIMDRFSAGRCFLVGDAAHQFSPTGGYGMNTGLGEAFDLSWKLAATLEGWGGPGLLASYEAERRPVAIRNARRATVNFDRMRQPREHPLVLAPGAAGDRCRREVGEAIRRSMAEEWESMGIHLGYSYAGSPIVCDDGAPCDHSDPSNYVQTACPGMRAPHVWLGPGRSTLDLFGRCHVLLGFDADADPGPLVAEARRQGMPLRYEALANPEAAGFYGRRWVLVRPDGHVAMRCDALPANPAAVVARVRGAAAAPHAQPALLDASAT